jgi:cell wall-associated NlpC family hydrolase
MNTLNWKKKTRLLTSGIVSLALSATLLSAPVAMASSHSEVSAVRSFPAQASASRRHLLSESTSVSSDASSQWGGIENLSIPRVDSPAQIKQKAQAQARAKAQAQQAQRQAARQQAASRSQVRQPLTSANSSSSAPAPSAVPQVVPASAMNAVSYAEQFVGQVPYVYGGNTPAGWDCSGMVQYVMGQYGVALPHNSGAQASAGRGVADISQAIPGDIIANSTHAAIYIGNGMVVNALNQRVGTVVSPLSVAFKSAYSIRRVLN